MQNITRLIVVVALLVSGTGLTVAAYLDCLHAAPEALSGTLAAEPADRAEPAPAPASHIVLSVDPTQDSVVSMR